MKRLFALLLIVVMVCSMFAACGKDPNPTDGKDTTPGTTAGGGDTTPDTTPTQPEEFKNTDKYPLEGEHKLSMAVALEDAANSYLFGMMSKATGIDFTYQYVTSEQAPLLFVEEDNMPDVFFGPRGGFGLSLNQIYEYGVGGALINFMDYLDKMPNLAKAYADHPDLFDGVMNADGSVYTIPYYVFTLTGVNNLFYYREDHMKAAGWDKAPTTTEEFTKYLKDLKAHFGANDSQYIPFTVYQTSHLAYNGQISRYLFPTFGDLMEAGITADSTGKKVVAGFATEQYKRYVTYLNGLMKEGLLDPDAFSAKGSLMKAFINEGHTSVNSLMVYMTESCFPSGNLDIILPAPLKSEYNNDTKWATPTVASNWAGMISKNCSDLDAALAYIDAYFATEDNALNEEGTIFNLSFWLGEKGVDWDWKVQGESYIKYEHTSQWEAQGYSGTPYIGKFTVLNYDHNDKVGFKALEVQKNLIPISVDVLRSTSLPLTQDEQEEYTDAWQDLSKYIDQMNAAFIRGEADPEKDWDEYIAKLNSMGLQDVLDIYQAALDRYNARQN